MNGRAVVIVALIGAFAVGIAVGFASSRDAGERSGDQEAAGIVSEGDLTSVPEAPLAVRAERVVLPAGFRSRHRHGGPTFNFVDDGTVVIESEGRERRYDAGGFFFEPGLRVHTITVLDDARLRVIRLLPPGAAATTEVP
jgi:hypothetical protein